jgi:hypothetical protein
MEDEITKSDVTTEVNEVLGTHTEEIAKAAETIATSTFSPASRSIFSPENLDEKIKLLVPTETPLRNRFPRVPGSGQAAAWKKLTSKLNTNVATGGTSTSVAFADAGAPNETSQTYSSVSATYKLLGRKIEVGVLANKASEGRGSEGSMMDHRERIKLYEVMLGEEEMIISGNATTRTTEFDGLSAQITTNSGTMTLVTASGIGTYCKTLYDSGASPTLLLVNATQMQALANNLEASGSIQRLVVSNGDQTGLTVGSAISRIINPVDGSLVDVRTSRYVGNQAYLLTERSVAGENWIEMDDLIPMSRVDVPSSNLSTISFVFEATVLKVIGEPFQYKFNGLATSL